ncbi:MAG: 30S ribosomal protein S12 methylthiotransferase RimO [Syntrophus sp. (in: bacteria)]|nr:30S ribosomal protein S12 methylthiotransferase RimO [Syntrophus sp. (in: bacteria)]
MCRLKFKIVSLGCPKNLVESEYIAHKLEQEGHSLSEDCDTIIINTCAFIADAAKESIETVLEEAQIAESMGRKLVVTGCLVERYKDSLQELLPEVDLFVGRTSYGDIGRLIDSKGILLKEGAFAETFPRRVLTSIPSAYLKIQEGCDNRCSYCTIPYIRGPLTSRSPENVKEEFKWLVGQGFREINIIGQDITAYGKGSGTNLKELLTSLLAVEGDYYIRLLYMHPRGIDGELLDIMGREERIIPYMDMPIQHSEDSILNRMGRGHSKEQLERLLLEMRTKLPDMTLRTTLIIGFPGETEEDFLNLCAFIRKWEFDALGAFTYSKEEGTRASTMKGHIKKGVKQERYNKIMEIQQEISKRRLARLVGRTMKVIIEGEEEEHKTGRLLIQAPDIDGIAFIKGEGKIGEIREGKIVKTLDYDVIVEI